MLRALPGALDTSLCAEAVQLLHFRAREPSASRFSLPAPPDEQLIAAWSREALCVDGALCKVDGVVVPLALLQETAPMDTARDGIARLDQAECLRRAEQLLTDGPAAQ